jgi:sulfate-transporting ATPase
VIDLGGGRSIPVRAFLALFGFRGGTQDKAVSALSGGERNRLLLARTLASGSNVLLLDEPTNDLDVDTLRSLEDAMPDFPGCAIVVSHDRYFLDRTATHILHFDGAGGTEFFEGNWGQFEAHLRKRGLGDKFLSDEDVFRQVSFNSA